MFHVKQLLINRFVFHVKLFREFGCDVRNLQKNLKEDACEVLQFEIVCDIMKATELTRRDMRAKTQEIMFFGFVARVPCRF